MAREGDELAREKAYVREAYELAQKRLDELHVGTAQGAHQQAAQAVRASQQDFIDETAAALASSGVFVMGRVDMTGEVEEEYADRMYVGRCGVQEPGGGDMPMVVNWRARAAALFYLSNRAAPPDGVVRKRTFQGQGGEVTRMFDEVYIEGLLTPDVQPPAKRRAPGPSQRSTGHQVSRPGTSAPRRPPREREPAAELDAAPSQEAMPEESSSRATVSSGHGDDALVAGDPLLEELERSSGSEMRDIVRTIQAEQYRLMTAPLDRHLVIQGGPGVGKTAVGLHRIALQLFRERDRLRPDDFLVVGPSPVFLRYVASVLPSLGESGVTHVSLDRLGPQPRPQLRTDSPAVAEVKGSARMADVLRAFVQSRISSPQDDIPLGDDLVLDREMAGRIIDRARARSGTYLDGRATVRDAWLAELAKKYRLPVKDVEHRTGEAFERALNRTWPSLSAVEAVSMLLSGGRLLQSAAAGILRPEEVALLLRDRATKLEDVQWTREDVALLDEVGELLNGPPERTYAHTLVDEGQNLSPMQWRMLARRCRGGNFTILGDLAQTTRHRRQPRSWDDLLQGTGIKDPQVETMSVGYRTQDAVMHWANRLLWAMNIDIPHVRSVRREGDPPLIVAAANPDAITEAAVEAATALPASRRIGIIAIERILTAVAEALHEMGVPAPRVGAEEGAGVVLATPENSHGLEFDDLVVVEPAAIMDQPEGALQRLYVCLTRTRGSLFVVHHRPLPPVLRPDQLEDPSVAKPVHM